MSAEIEPAISMFDAELVDDDDGAPAPTGRELLAEEIGMARYVLAKIQQPLTRATLADEWISGLREAGYPAKHGVKWNGKYPADLPFVVSIPCPFEHPNEDDTDFATTLLIVAGDGWPYFSDKLQGQCKSCSETALEEWMLDCPRCESGENNEWHSPGHPKGIGHRRGNVRNGGENGILGDTSPLSYVVYRFEHLSMVARARRWIEHFDAAAAEYRTRNHYEDGGGVSRGLIDDQIERAVESARRVLAVPVLKAVPIGPVKPVYDQAATVKFLDELTDADGKLIVPPSASGAAAWEAIRLIQDRPPKHAIWPAQVERKNRPTS